MALMCSSCNLECITSKTKRSNSFVAINFEPSTPIHAVDEEAEVEDRTQQTPLLQSPEDRTNTFPSPTQLAERMMDPIAISHTISDVKHLDTASLSKSRRKVKALNNLPVLARSATIRSKTDSCDHCRVRKRRCTRQNGGSTPCENCLARFQECITSIPRRSNSKLVVRNLRTSTPIHAVDEEVEVEDCTQLTRFPQNPEDLNTISAPFQIPTFLSTARLPERTIPDTSDSLINADPVSYNYKGREHRSYTEYLDTVCSESWKLKALNSRPRDGYVYDSNISEYTTCLYPSQQISNNWVFEIEPCAKFFPIFGENIGLVDVVGPMLYPSQQISNNRVFDIKPCAKFFPIFGENVGLVDVGPTIISEHSSSLYTSQQINNNRPPCADFSPFCGENRSLAHVAPRTISQYSSSLYSQPSSHDQLL